MAQEITVIVKVDIQAALQENTLSSNVYMVDNQRTAGSTEQGTDKLCSYCKGFTWSNGAQASEQLINWLVTGVASPPTTYPEKAVQRNTQIQDKARQQEISKLAANLKPNAPQSALDKVTKAISGTAIYPKIRGLDGLTRLHSVPLITQHGQAFDRSMDLDDASHLAPIITHISGEAVDKNVIYPAQYGTPIDINSGWYWCASVDTNIPGRYSYTMDILIHQLAYEDGEYVWKPYLMQHDAFIEVVTEPKYNGFTGAGAATLPVV